MQLQWNPADQPTNQELCKNGKPQILRVMLHLIVRLSVALNQSQVKWWIHLLGRVERVAEEYTWRCFGFLQSDKIQMQALFGNQIYW